MDDVDVVATVDVWRHAPKFSPPHSSSLSLLQHVSPIEWDNVVLYGQYVLNQKLVGRGSRAAVA